MGKVRLNPHRYHIVEYDDKQYFVKTAHDRHRYVNEYLYSALAPRSFLRCLGAYIPEAIILEGPDGLTGATEYLFGLCPAIDRISPSAVSAMAVLDACFHNCDRTLKNVGRTPRTPISVWFDHEHALVGNGDTDLHRFHRTDIGLRGYIKTPGLNTVNEIVAKNTITAIRGSVNMCLVDAVSNALDAELISEVAAEALGCMPEWITEVESRIESGRFFEEIL
ncbi:MAG: hypothetical protein UY48_C0003G0103 [Candidatus Gottesmanbacteria bacterium GW2011_GWB1_49_7]|uniref:Uncharacterized protein n=1 Tax=Candidatus Gottesmanbacteria bacterium GW2011_GWB1_49_7 TaxID=1618448 RepID=A0A0G1W3E6_9BACT|nr:MAG: hypothetical protein UY48_C0003G0103 [Candidatus Gottesmanbacteria bacterium GW2011_GWB1_49_7]